MGLGEEQDGQTCSRTLANPLALAATKLLNVRRSHLFEWNTCENGAGELGESVYGLKADFRWPAVGEGMSWVAVAMLHLCRHNAAPKLHGGFDLLEDGCWSPERLPVALTPCSV